MAWSMRSTAVLVLAASVAAGTAIVVQQWRIARSTGCGATSLYALCRVLGIKVSSHEILARFGRNASEASFADIQAVGSALGVTLDGRKMTVETIRRHRPLGILHLDGFHFVAAVGYEEYGVVVADPIGAGETQVSVWPYAYLGERWDGRMLVLRQAKSTHGGGHREE